MFSAIMAKIIRTAQNVSPTFVLTVVGTMVVIGFLSYWGAIPDEGSSLSRSIGGSVQKQLRAFTWNMAAINNNPFGRKIIAYLFQ